MIVPAKILEARDQARTAGSAIVLVTGVFDVLHQEHRIFLEKAKALGWLVVGIESDQRVRAMKGLDRPVNPQSQRLATLRNLGIADQVFVLPEDFATPGQRESLIAELQPDFLAVSSHTAHQERKQAILQKYGGLVKVVHQHNPQISTTQLLQTPSTGD